MSESFTFSQRTLDILKNFNTISSGQIFRRGSVIQTVSAPVTIFARANIVETIPFDFALPNLGNLLAIMSLYKGEVVVQEDIQTVNGKTRKVVVVVGDGKLKNIFVPCDPMMIPNHDSYEEKTDPRSGEKIAPLVDRVFSPPDVKITFDLQKATMSKALEAARVFSSDIIRFTAADGVLTMHTANATIKSAANEFATELCETDIVGEWDYSLSSLVALPNDYKVKITPKGLMLLESSDVSYAIARRKD